MFKKTFYLILSGLVLMSHSVNAAKPFDDKFRQLDEILPTPNDYRAASGAPGHRYWQQRADYDIKVRIDDEKQRLIGREEITYTNFSPDSLTYIWVQLDQNRYRKDSDYNRTMTMPSNSQKGADGKSIKGDRISFRDFRPRLERSTFEGGFNIEYVTDSDDKPLKFTINKTMMRIDLPRPLGPGSQTRFKIGWNHNIVEQKVLGGRGGYEYFKEDDNYLYEIAQWYPRVAVYSDYEGWHNKQFLGRGEFTLEFGDYEVEITVPADHIVASTGVLQNPGDVLTTAQRERLTQAQTAQNPVLIVTPDEALANEKSRAKATKTWVFKADDVRDFAFASSRKFIWDAQGYTSGGNQGLAMSFYPKEGNPLWERYSTQAIIHTIEVYNKYALAYPYPVAISVNGPVGGMEYPMICFNGPRPTFDPEDKTKYSYSDRTKYGLISVIIHEVGHFYYPMIINSDERQWTWMDEGLNTFVQFLAEQEWEEKYPSRRGEARKIINYMSSEAQVPIMTNSESILQFGNNAYGKPATALNILRETILGRELFDFAFREYARRWWFKRPTPSDFFRTMEDASAVDLDWFWRGWFYTTDNVDIAIDEVKLLHIDTKNPDIERAYDRAEFEAEPISITEQRNQGMSRRVERRPDLKDYYNENDQFTVTNADKNKYNKYLDGLVTGTEEPWREELLKAQGNAYVLSFSNLGGLVMPVILDITYQDKSKEELRIPAEIWRYDPEKARKLIIRDKLIESVVVDPHWETADINVENNYYPRRIVKSKLELFKQKRSGRDQLKENQEELKPRKGEETDEKKTDQERNMEVEPDKLNPDVQG